MDKRETPASIGKHYGVRPFEIYKVMEDMKMGIKAMGAKLTASQAENLHTYFQNTIKYRAAEAARQSTVRSMLLRPALPAVELKLQNFPKRCQCCDTRWVLTAKTNRLEPWCPHCKDHAPRDDDGPVEQVGRAEDHAAHFEERSLSRWMRPVGVKPLGAGRSWRVG